MMHWHLLGLLGLPNFSTSTLMHLLDTWGYPLVALFIAVESTGIPFPGETMLVTAAVYAGTGHLSIFWVIVSAAIGAIMGDNFGYLAGRHGGRRLVLRFGKYVRIKPHHLDYAERFFQKHGDKTVFLGRHLAVLRAWAALLAGTNRMPWPKFLLYNAAGGIVWTVMYGILGYVLGNNLPLLHRVVTILGVIGVVIAALLVLALFVIWKRRQARKMVAGETRPPNEVTDRMRDQHGGVPPAL